MSTVSAVRAEALTIAAGHNRDDLPHPVVAEAAVICAGAVLDDADREAQCWGRRLEWIFEVSRKHGVPPTEMTQREIERARQHFWAAMKAREQTSEALLAAYYEHQTACSATLRPR